MVHQPPNRIHTILCCPQWKICGTIRQQQEPGEEFDDLYEILQHRAEPIRTYIARFNHEEVAIPECNAATAISAFKRGMIPDGYLYKELTKYQCKSMKNILSRACGQVKREEDVSRRAKAQ